MRLSRSVISAVAVLGAFSVAGAAVARPADQIRISVPTHVRRHITYDVILQGFSRTRAKAYLFVDYAACARSFAAERRRAANESDHYKVRGKFDEISGWRSSSPGVDHACAYLVATRSGRLLASFRVKFRIH